MDRPSGLSVRLKLTLSYAGFLMLASVLLLAAVWLFLLHYVPDRALLIYPNTPLHGVFPDPLEPPARLRPEGSRLLAFLLVFGLVGGWFLAGRMLAPLARITDATRIAAAGSLSHRIQLPGRSDEFRALADSFDTMLARLETHVTEQQRFAANASHELRTPLAIMQTLLDVARTITTATTANSSTASTTSTREQSTSPKRCSCSAAPTSGPSSANPSTCP